MIKRLGKFWRDIREKKEVASVRRGMMKLAVGVAVGICCVGVASGNGYAAYSSTTYGVHNLKNPTYSSSGTPYNYIYFGKVPDGDSNYDTSAQGKEIYWRVLNTTANDDNGTPAFFVLTEYGISQKAWDENNNGSSDNYRTCGQIWDDYYATSSYGVDRASTVRGFLNGIPAGGIDTYNGNGMYQNCFTEKERGAILNTVKMNSEEMGCYDDSCNPNISHATSAPGATNWYIYKSLNNRACYAYGCPLRGDYIFLLSGSEAKNSSYGFKGDGTSTAASADNNRICKLGASAESNSWWWLRSGTSYKYEDVTRVVQDGSGNIAYSGGSNLVLRCALNINLASVILTSPASGASPSSTLVTLSPSATIVAAGTAESTSNASRLTIYDSSRNNFNVYPSSISQKAGNSIRISYDGMPTTGSDYISVILFNSSKSTVYYGRLKEIGESASSGWATMIVPSISEGTYTLRVLNEYQETDRVTSYAGYKDITLTVTLTANTDTTGPTVTNVYKNGGGTYFKLTASDSSGLSDIRNSDGSTILKGIGSLGTSGTCNVETTSGTTALRVYDVVGNYSDVNSDILTDSTPPVIDEVSYENGKYIITLTDEESGIWKLVGNNSDSTTTTLVDYST